MKHLDLSTLSDPFNNPFMVFCYPHQLHLLESKIHLFNNKFVLITHNSDENITDKYATIVNHEKVIRMYSQNTMFEHPKLSMIPIGIANSMWKHGDMSLIQRTIDRCIPKSKDVYFYFTVGTSPQKRYECKLKLEQKGLVFGSNTPYEEYIQDLASHKFSICPEGNGADSHRIWESLYVGTIPILVKSPFSLILQKLYPCIVLERWEDFEIDSILAKYEELTAVLQCVRNTLTMSYFENMFKNGSAFDIVIPVGPSEYSHLSTQIENTKKNVKGFRHIYIVTDIKKNLTRYPGCVYVDEAMFPFSISSIEEHHGASSRNGWYLQQLLKMYSGFVIPGILNHYLVIDADTHFMRPTAFMENGFILFNTGGMPYQPYFVHMKKLHPSLHKKSTESAVTHHMMFTRTFVKDLFNLVESHHNMPFWKVFITSVSPQNFTKSGASEYEIYFNYMLIYHRRFIKTRRLKWKDSESLSDTDFDYISCHWYMRK